MASSWISMSLSMFLKSQKAFFLARDALRQVSEDLDEAKDVLAFIQEIVFNTIFSILDGDKLRQSAIILQTLLTHTARS